MDENEDQTDNIMATIIQVRLATPKSLIAMYTNTAIMRHARVE